MKLKYFLLASCLLPSLLSAQGTADASLLEFTPDAQSAGMGGTGLAITNNGSTAIFHNVSTIAFSYEVLGAGYSYSHIGSDDALQSASLFYRIGKEGKHGFTAGFLHSKRPASIMTGNYRPHSWALEAGYFTKASKDLALSLTLKYLQAKADASASVKRTACLDLGVSYHRSMKMLDENASWTVGLQGANLGKKLDGQQLPARIGLGGSIDLPFNPDNELQAALDLNYLLPSQYRHLQVGVGAEYNFLRYGVIRAGYHLGSKNKGTGNYGTLGAGVRVCPLHADFSYILAGNDCLLKNSWQISIGITL